MAFPTPAAFFLDENPQIQRGKRVDAPRGKALKSSAKPGLQERKALQDLSNTSAKPVHHERKALQDLSNTSAKPGLQERKPLQNVSNKLQDRSILRDKSILKEKPTLKDRSDLRSHEGTKKSLKIYADEETKKCHEWAKDGVEGAHFTGNDSQKLDKDVQDKRVKKKVEKVVAALHGWSDVVFNPVIFPATEVSKFFEEVKGLELEPEILPDISSHLSSSGDKVKLAEDSFTDDELDQYPFLDNNPVTFELRDEAAIPQLGVY